MEQLSLFEDKKEKSTDWKWTMANDYPKEKNGFVVYDKEEGFGQSVYYLRRQNE